MMYKTLLALMIGWMIGGCASPNFEYMSKRHTDLYTAVVLSEIQHDICVMTPAERHQFLSRVNNKIRVLNDDGWLVVGCGSEPRIPVFE